MNRAPSPTTVCYFGKIPSRADFVKASDNLALTQVLDEWLANAMELLSTDARWKINYDAQAPLHFAFVGPRSKRAIAGHIVTSSDQSHRRFPFLMVSTIEVDDPVGFVGNGPLVLSRLWNRFEALTAAVLAAPDPALPLQAVTATLIELDLRSAAYDAAFNDFLELQSVGSLEAMLAQAGFEGSVRQLLLAMGLLLQPVLASSSSRLEKSLVLPLPADPMYRYLVAAFWMHLITPFLVRAGFELAICVTRLQDRPTLVVGFSGASAATLQAIIDPQAALERHITFDDLSWVDEQVDSDFAVQKVSAYLEQPSLSLKSAHDSLRLAFIGS
ncbi:MAG: type VI secretion system-associated protein TagF [Pseudomonadota bacterium]